MRPGLDDDLVGFLIVSAITFLVLDRGKRPAENFRFARLVAASNSKFKPATANDVEHRRLFGDSNEMPPGYDIRRLSKPDLGGAGCNRSFHQQRIRAELGALGLEMMLGHEEVVEAQAVGEDPLPNLL